MQIKEALTWGHEQLLLTSDSARLDAEILLSNVLKKPATFLLVHDEQKISSINWWRYQRLIQKRKKGIPVAYLTNHKEFFLLDFHINRHVLVPRPDTEFLVESVIEYIPKVKCQMSNVKCLLLDIGTGSGCIPISVLKNVEGIKAIATDISRAALRVAKRNIKKNRLQSRIKLIRSDLLENVSSRLLHDHEVIVTANLPYLPPSYYEVNPELKFEPRLALHGGEEGMDVYKRLIGQLKEFRPRAIFLELFEFQIATLKTKLPDYHLKYVKDMSGEARVLVMERTK